MVNEGMVEAMTQVLPALIWGGGVVEAMTQVLQPSFGVVE